MDNEYVLTVVRLVLAMVAGSLIGLERTYHGRPAGFRTHILVCTASSLLMLLTVFSGRLTSDIPIETLRIDPTRMAQGADNWPREGGESGQRKLRESPRGGFPTVVPRC